MASYFIPVDVLADCQLKINHYKFHSVSLTYPKTRMFTSNKLTVKSVSNDRPRITSLTASSNFSYSFRTTKVSRVSTNVNMYLVERGVNMNLVEITCTSYLESYIFCQKLVVQSHWKCATEYRNEQSRAENMLSSVGNAVLNSLKSIAETFIQSSTLVP